MLGVLNDLRFTLRQLTRQRGYAIAAVLSLGLAIGATVTTFSVVDGVVFRPLPFPDASRLVTICERNPSVEGFCIASPPDVEDWKTGAPAFQTLGIARDWSMRLVVDGRDVPVYSGVATGGVFAALGVRPELGRLIGPNEYGPAHRVALLSDALWRSQFGADPGVVGKTVRLDGDAAEIVGVLPPHTDVPHLEGMQLWASLPFDPHDETNRGWRGFVVYGRLGAGVSLATARAQLTALSGRLAEAHPETNRGWGVSVIDLRESVVGAVRPRLLIFLAAVGLVLLLGCVNLANLMLARTARRDQEIALRRAIGATSTRLTGLVLMESLVISVAGAALGVLLATWGVSLFVALGPPGIPRLADVGINAPVLLFALALAAFTTMVIGLVPALRGSRTAFADRLRASRSARRGGGVLVVAETAIAVVLLAGAGLLGRAFVRLTSWQPGFDRHGLAVAWTGVSQGSYATQASVSALYRRALDEVRALPGVTAASLTSGGPLFGGEEPGTAHTLDAAGDSAVVLWRDVGPAYFHTLGLPLKAGRDFTDGDRAGQPTVAIVNETAARRLWPGRPALGRRFTMPEEKLTLTVVGVVADIPSFRPDQPVRPEVYWPYFQAPRWGAYFVVRGAGGAAALAQPLRERLGAVDHELEPSRVSALDAYVQRELVSPRFNAVLIGTFAAVAALLAAVGIAGLVAYRVSRRGREIGVRLALGAVPAQVVRAFVAEGGTLILVGVVVGTLAAVVATRSLGAMLAGTSPTDPIAFGSVIGGMLAVGLIAAWVPARRASRIDPLEALRVE